jgi:hypothetical protein
MPTVESPRVSQFSKRDEELYCRPSLSAHSQGISDDDRLISKYLTSEIYFSSIPVVMMITFPAHSERLH